MTFPLGEALYCPNIAKSGDTDAGAILVAQMNRFYKTFLLWLLVAVLPLHAAAGAMSMSCGPIHQQAMQVASMNDAHHQHGGSDDSHVHHHDAATPANAVADTGDADDASTGTHQHATCSACTATCIGASAPPSALSLTPTFSGSEMVTVSPVALVVGTPPSDLERPPKPTLA